MGRLPLVDPGDADTSPLAYPKVPEGWNRRTNERLAALGLLKRAAG